MEKHSEQQMQDLSQLVQIRVSDVEFTFGVTTQLYSQNVAVIVTPQNHNTLKVLINSKSHAVEYKMTGRGFCPDSPRFIDETGLNCEVLFHHHNRWVSRTDLKDSHDYVTTKSAYECNRSMYTRAVRLLEKVYERST